MPSKYVVRNFVEGGIYHLYNRGVEKRPIFIEAQDYQVFLYYLFVYTASPETVLLRYPDLPLRFLSKNLNGRLDLLAYCLMPNHFHLLIKQNSGKAISSLIKQVTNAYVLYFNNKYQRVGGLMQGRFKSVEVNNDTQLIHTSRYIHLNPLVARLVTSLENYRWASYLEYVTDEVRWKYCKKDLVLATFANPEKYRAFVLDQSDYAKELGKIKPLLLEEN